MRPSSSFARSSLMTGRFAFLPETNGAETSSSPLAMRVVAVVEVKTTKRLDPRSLDRLALPDRPVIVYADWLSPRTRELLRGRGASYVDSTGNVDVNLSSPPIVLRADGAQRDPNPSPKTSPTFRGPRAWALMRTLVEVRPPYTAGDLSARLDVDNGYVSRVLQALVDERLIERAPRRPVTDVEWEPLLRQLVSTYSLFDSNETSTWVASNGPEEHTDSRPCGRPVCLHRDRLTAPTWKSRASSQSPR